jgi:hypothetical protein
MKKKKKRNVVCASVENFLKKRRKTKRIGILIASLSAVT